jgi:hypothetical protein
MWRRLDRISWLAFGLAFVDRSIHNRKPLIVFAKGSCLMAGQPIPLQQVLTLLADTPTRITTLTADLTSAQLHARPTPDEWSANEVLAHLRSCADVWGNCIQTILDQDRPTIKAVNPTTWINQTNYPALDFKLSLSAFVTQRSALLAVLNALPPDAWARSATVTGAGKALERTVLFYAQWLARHERSHYKQIETLVKIVRGSQG